MKTYVVGGFVRDTILGLEPKDRDYVVVGATPEQMLAEGFTQVGASFPVFLKGGEEYALARTERKNGKGYHGFDVNFDPSTTLEDDLMRRDLTVNAIALDDDGTFHDPHGGKTDIENRVLRHVSPAFRDDPVRVLRVARFAARYADLGFTVAPETMDLMREMVDAGELNHLTAERVWKELSGALSESKPSMFLQVLRQCGALKVVLPEIDGLYGVPQNATYHPEIDTGVHTEMVIDVAASETDRISVLFAALCHDLGKALTPPAEWPAHRGHEERGVGPVEALCERLKVPANARALAVMACREHLNVHRIDELQAKTLHDLIERCGGLQGDGDTIVELALVCEADKRGRLGLVDTDYPQGTKLIQARNAIRAVRFADLPTRRADGEPYVRSGEQVGKDLRMMRIAAIKALRP